MLNNSILTASDLRERFASNKKDDNITDRQVRDALNDFYSIVGRLERQYAPEKYRAVVSGAMPFDLSTIELGDMDLMVYESEISSLNYVPKRFAGSVYRGWYVVGETLDITFDSTADFAVVYNKKTPRIASSETLDAHVLQIDRDMERALYLYLQMMFFDGEYQLGLRDDAEAKAIEELQRYFGKTPSPVGL